MPNRAKVHHYVPQHLIGNFSANDRGQVNVFDLSSERTFLTNPRNICAENGFNEFRFEEWVVSFESAVTRFEALYQPVIAKVLDQKSLLNFTDDELLILRMFVAFQFLRTKFLRTQLEQLNQKMFEHFEAMGVPRDQVQGIEEIDEERAKRFYLTKIFEDTKSFATMLQPREVFLMEAPSDHPLLLGDHPVVLHNDRDFGAYGNIGWALPGIQIYTPISPQLCVTFWCRSILDDAIQRKEQLQRLVFQSITRGNQSLREVLRQIDYTEEKYRGVFETCEKLRSGIREATLLDADEDQVNLVNSLQVSYANRYLISAQNGFELPKRMIADNPAYKDPPAPTLE